MAEEKTRESRAISRWDPFAEMEALARWSPLRESFPFPSRLGRMLEDFWGERSLAPMTPAIDVTESDKQYTVTVELPGVDRDDVSVEVQGGTLSIRGEKKREEKKEKGRWIERSYGSFQRAFTLPSDAQADKVEASFKNGVLTLEIPRSEEKKPRVVAVKS